MATSGDRVVEAYNVCLGFVPCMVAKAVCELGIPGILAAHHPQPLSALDIAQLLRPAPPRPLHEAAEQLDRMLKCLCAYKVVNAHVETDCDAHVELLTDNPHAGASAAGRTIVKYSSTRGSRCLATLQGYLLLHTSSQLQRPWQYLSQRLLHGLTPFTAIHSMDLWALAASDPAFNGLFNSGMAADCDLSSLILLQHYKGFQDGTLTQLVDVGGGTGTLASTIATHYPFIQVINFDVPAVIAMAPIHPGVQHVAGDMFQSIPPGDAILLKWVLHTWDDEDCIKVLDNCHKVLPRHGKLIIVDAVLDFASMEDSPFNHIRFALDMIMLTHTKDGKERTKKQWEVLLGAAKFALHKIIDLPSPQCVIEAISL